MTPWLREVDAGLTPELLCRSLRAEPGLILLESTSLKQSGARYSFVVARPFLVLRVFGARCELLAGSSIQVRFGNPWQVLDDLMARFEIVSEFNSPLPLGGCFGFWGYSLRYFVEPRLSRRAPQDLELPDAWLGFYSSLVVFDHKLNRTFIVSTGLTLDGTRNDMKAEEEFQFWQGQLEVAIGSQKSSASTLCPDERFDGPVQSNLSQSQFLTMIERACEFIRAGDIYQINLSQRFSAPWRTDPWLLYLRMQNASPAPFASYFNEGRFQIISTSPEQFLRGSGDQIVTRPIKGTRPRSTNRVRDLQLARELQTSEKELAELLMITDLLRNDFGRVCKYGSVEVPELVRLERFSQVQHLVSTIKGQLRPEWTHASALAACFPGGSITGAPKVRAMEIIEELEPLARGPYTGAMGYLGFNRETQLSILIRTAICLEGLVHFQTGAGIVADSIPEAEYRETLAKAAGFFKALGSSGAGSDRTFGPADFETANRDPQNAAA